MQRSLLSIQQKIAFYKSIYMPEAVTEEESNHPFRLCFDVSQSIRSVQQLPGSLENFLAVRTLHEGMNLVGEVHYNLDWPRKYYFLSICSIFYQAFPDFDWNPSNVKQQGNIWGFEVEPTGTHTQSLQFDISEQSYVVPPTGLDIPIPKGKILARIQDEKVIELSPEFREPLDLILLNFTERILEGSYS